MNTFIFQKRKNKSAPDNSIMEIKSGKLEIENTFERIKTRR